MHKDSQRQLRVFAFISLQSTARATPKTGQPRRAAKRTKTARACYLHVSKSHAVQPASTSLPPRRRQHLALLKRQHISTRNPQRTIALCRVHLPRVREVPATHIVHDCTHRAPEQFRCLIGCEKVVSHAHIVRTLRKCVKRQFSYLAARPRSSSSSFNTRPKRKISLRSLTPGRYRRVAR